MPAQWTHIITTSEDTTTLDDPWWAASAATWANSTTTIRVTLPGPITMHMWPAEADEDRERRRLVQEATERREARGREMTRFALAQARARDLLASLLPTDTREHFERTGDVPVIGSAGGHYTLRPGHSNNIRHRWTDEHGREHRETLCAHPRMHTPDGRLPDDDARIAQYLALRANEGGFRAVANVTRLD